MKPESAPRPRHLFPPRPTRLARAVLLACLCLGTTAAPAARAQAEAAQSRAAAPARYDIPAGPLDRVLNRFALDAGILLSFDGALAADDASRGLAGSYSVPEALRALLEPHGLEAVPGAGGGYVVRSAARKPSAPAPGAEATLPVVTITGVAEHGGGSEGVYRLAGRTRSATRLALSAEETPQSISIVTRQRLDDQKLDSVLDVIDATIGVSSYRMSVGADLGQPYARGFSISNYLVDGIPSTVGSAGDRANTVMYDRVEVLRGANGLTSGMGYPGASINLVRKRPTRAPQASASAEAGSWQRYGAGLDVSRPLSASGAVRARLVLDHKQKKSWVDRYEGADSVAYGILEADLGPDTLLTLGFSHQVNDNDSPLRSGIPLYYADGGKIGLPDSYNPSPTWSYYDTTDSSVFASLRHTFANGWKASVETAFLRDSYDAIAPYAYGNPDRVTGLGMSMTAGRWDETNRQASIDAYLSGTFAAFGREHDLVMGLSAARSRSTGPDYGNWLYPWNSSYDGTVRTNYSAYLTGRFSLSDSTRLIVGARVLDDDSRRTATAADGAATRQQRKDSGIVVPYAGLVRQLDDAWSLYGSYSQIFRPQSFAVVDINRRQLDPEEGDAFEAGVKGSLLQNRLGVSLALFKVRQKKLAEYDALTQAYRQLEGIRSQGVELELTGRLARGWNLSAGYAYSVSEDKAGKRVMERIPKNTVKTFTTYQLPGALQRWTVGGGVTWQSRTGWDDARSQGWDLQHSYALASLMARYRVSDATEVALNVQNAFDERYFTGLADMGVYGAPRNAVLTLKHRF